MTKRLIINVLLAYILLTLIILIRDYIQIDIIHDNSVFSGTFLEYITGDLIMITLIIPTMFSIFVLVPYNILILKIKGLRLIYKILLFEVILIFMFCLMGTFTNVWSTPYWLNIKYFICFLPISAIFSSIIHIAVDKNID